MKQPKAVFSATDDEVIIEPKVKFWSLAGSLSSKTSLSDGELKQARLAFSKQWSQYMIYYRLE